MQYSKDGKTWPYESQRPFQKALESAARSLGLKNGDVFYTRAVEGSAINKMTYRTA